MIRQLFLNGVFLMILFFIDLFSRRFHFIVCIYIIRSLHHSQPQLDQEDGSGFRRHGTVLIPTVETMGHDSLPQSHATQPSAANNNERGFILPLRQRDLRRLEANTYNTAVLNNSSSGNNFTSILPEQDPYILIRKHVVLFSFGELVSAVVQAERLILIVHHQAYGAEAALEQLERHISGTIHRRIMLRLLLISHYR